MSKITTIYNKFLTEIPLVLTTGNGWNRIPNPYSLPDNPQQYLSQGWGLAIDNFSPESPATTEICNKYYYSQNFSIPLTTEVTMVDTKQDGFDAPMLLIAEAINSLLDHFLKVDDTVFASSLTVLRQPSGTEPAPVFAADNKRFITREIRFNLRIEEIHT